MKMGKKQCTKCRQPLSLECFRISKGTVQLTKYCVKCLDICKKSRQQTKCKHGRENQNAKTHNKQRPQCKDCGGSQICGHNKKKSSCKDCDGSQICEHNRERSKCKDCGGSQICEHNKRRSSCPICDPLGHLFGAVRGRVYIALKNNKEMTSAEYLGCNIKRLKNTLSNNS